MNASGILCLMCLIFLGFFGLIIIMFGSREPKPPLTDKQLERLCAESAAKRGTCRPRKLKTDCAYCPVFCDTLGPRRKDHIRQRRDAALIWLFHNREDRIDASTEEAAAREAMAKQDHVKDLP